MGFQVVAFQELANKVKESVKTLLTHHRLDPNQQEESLKQLDDTRRIHAQLLLKIVGALEHSNWSPIQKAHILNGAVYFVRYQIDLSYKRLNLVSVERSSLYNSLTSSLDLKKDNTPNREDLIELYSNFLTFLQANVYLSGDPGKGYLEEQIFSKTKIKGYQVETDIESLSDKINELKKEQRKEAFDAQAKHLAEAKKGTKPRGMLSLFAGAETAKTPVATSSPAQLK